MNTKVRIHHVALVIALAGVVMTVWAVFKWGTIGVEYVPLDARMGSYGIDIEMERNGEREVVFPMLLIGAACALGGCLVYRGHSHTPGERPSKMMNW